MRISWMACLLLALPPAAWGQDAPAAEETKALAEKIEHLKRKVRDPLRVEYARRREALSKEADLTNFRYDIENAKKAYETRLATDPPIVQARQAVQAAQKALPQITKTQLESNPKILEIQKEIDARRAARPTFETTRQGLRKQLYALREEMKKVPAVQKAYEASRTAEKAYYELPRTHPTFLAARKARDQARAVLEEAIKRLPEKKALDAAQQAYDHLKKNSPHLAQARQARDQARQAYEQAIEQALRANPQGSAVQKRIEQVEQQRESNDIRRRELERQILDVRRDVAKNDPAIVQARKACLQTQQVYQKAIRDQTADEQKKMAEARRALEKKLNAKVAEDIRVQDIRERLKKVEHEIMEVYKQMKDLQRQQKQRERAKAG